MFRDPNEDGVNESQPPGSIPDFEEYEDDIPIGDLEAGLARRVSSTLRHPAWEFSDFLPLSFGRVEPAC
jgi:hypothetical protein